MNNLVINDKDVVEVIKVLKYVNIGFSKILNPITTKQIPGDKITSPVVDARLINTNSSYKSYELLYRWEKDNIQMPHLVPNIDSTYVAYNIKVLVPIDNVELIYYPNSQIQNNEYIINTEEPLYIKAETMDGIIRRVVNVENNIVVGANNTYNQYLRFYISGASIYGGTPKSFETKLSFYKDLICTKYIGSINIYIDMYDTTGPGE